MVAEVTLTVTEGSLRGKRFTFKKPTQCMAGRAEDCPVRLAGTIEHTLVSRHHCVLDIDPPVIRVRDLGSRNGTFVNGQIIGQRAKGETPEEATELPSTGYELKNGDELGLGPIVLRVSVTGAPGKSG
jgi:eukaryotic-like serine/threonine-protein kinase